MSVVQPRLGQVHQGQISDNIYDGVPKKSAMNAQNRSLPRAGASAESQMAEFQRVVENYSSSLLKSLHQDVITSPPPPSPSPTATIAAVRSDEDGYLHPDVGIDHELERLLAENPGLYMDDESPANSSSRQFATAITLKLLTSKLAA